MRGCVDLDLIDDWDKVIDSMDLPKKITSLKSNISSSSGCN